MKERINMTFDPEYIEKHMEYLNVAGLNRSQYFNLILENDVKSLNQIVNDGMTFSEVKKIVKEHFNSKTGGGDFYAISKL